MKVHYYSGGSWVLATSWFTYADAAGGDDKRITLTPINDWVGGSYRVTREPEALNSLEVADAMLHGEMTRLSTLPDLKSARWGRG